MVVAGPVSGVAIAHGREDPRKINAGTTTREKKVVVVLVLLGRRALKCGALDRKDRSIIVGRQEDVPTKPDGTILPAEGETLGPAVIELWKLKRMATYDVPSRIEIIPVRLAWKSICIAAHARKLGKRVPVLNVRSKHLDGIPRRVM